MYQSKISISTENRKNLEQKFLLFLSSNNYTYCKSLKRKVSFKKLPEAILNRQESAGSRLRRFFVAVDILKSEKTIKVREHQGCREFEIVGIDNSGTKVYVHLREETTNQKDRVLYFVSCY